MKLKLLSILSLILLLPQVSNAGVLDESYASGIKAYWKLEETSSVRVDTHASNDLTDNNTVLYAAGKLGDAADIERANSEYLSITDASQVGLDECPNEQFFINGWVNWESLENGNWNGIVSKWSNSSPGYYSGILRDNTTYDIIFGVRSAAATTFGTTENITAPTTGSWYMYTFVYNGVSGEKRIFINAVQEDLETGGPSDLANSTSDFTIGWMNRTSGADGGDGLFDEFMFSCGTITADEVTALYNSGDALAYESTGGGTSTSSTSTVTTSSATSDDLIISQALFNFFFLTFFIFFGFIFYFKRPSQA